MKLFIAINFNEPTKEKIMLTIKCLKTYSKRGNFTKRDNLHLTLAFLDEIKDNRIPELKRAIDCVSENEFNLKMSGLGKFSRDYGLIYWLGIEESDELINIYNQLYKQLSNHGYKMAEKTYIPHMTLGREIVSEENFDENAFSSSIPKIECPVFKVSLMKSERVYGKLKYTEIYSKELKHNN